MFLKKNFYLLLVCKANITRSIYMHAYMNKILKKYTFSKKINIMSVGTNAIKGLPPHDVIRHIAALNELTIKNLKSKRISQKIVDKANLILTMENEQKKIILKKFNNVKNKTFRILEYGQNNLYSDNLDIPDPTGKDTNDYKKFIEISHTESKRILKQLSEL